MAVVVAPAPLLDAPSVRPASSVLRAVLQHSPLAAVLGLVIGIHLPTLTYYFFGDDFVALGDAATRSFPAYMKDVILLRDLTPNWRPLTMAVYYAEYDLFGLNATAWRSVNLGVHALTVGMVYALAYSMSRRVIVAATASATFGVAASAVHTVTYITAFPHILSEFFLVAALLALHRYVASGERAGRWYWASFGLYALGFLANEGGVVMVAAIAAYLALTSFRRTRDPLDYVVKMLPFVAAAGLLAGGLAGCGCQGVDGGFYGFGSHIFTSTWLYLARLAYPVGAIAHDPSATEWAWGSVVAGFAIFFIVRGPLIARVAAVAMIAGLMPYAPSKMWTATRYTYLALPFFAILVGVAVNLLHEHIERVSRPLAHALASGAIAAAASLLAWQAVDQTHPFLKDSDRWRLLNGELQRNYDDLPPGSSVFVIDDAGEWTNPYWQPTWMSSIAHVLYGRDVTLRAIPSWALPEIESNLDSSVHLLQYTDGRLQPVTPATLERQPE